MSKKRQLGIYSAKAVAAGNGEVIYRREDGTEVAVTMVTDDLEPDHISQQYHWDDARSVGVVCEFVRTLSRGSNIWIERGSDVLPR